MPRMPHRVKGVTGKVEVNRRERDLRVFRHLSSYIPQQDHVIPTLTVMESMFVAASLKLPSTVSYKDKCAAVCLSVFKSCQYYNYFNYMLPFLDHLYVFFIPFE